jgi:hypothetical protein
MNPDIVYLYAEGCSMWRERELGFSLRSLQKHGKDFGNVFIVGDKPKYLNDNIIHIPKEDDKSHCKERRLYEKILTACRTGEISDPFIFFNDDFFLVKDMNMTYIPFYYFNTLEVKATLRPKKDIYYKALKNTYEALKSRGLSTIHFDIHYPMYYHKEWFEKAMATYDWTIRGGYVVKSLYANTMKLKGDPRKDCKIYRSHSKKEIMGIITGTDLFSTEHITRTMALLFQELYPEKSSYEI